MSSSICHRRRNHTPRGKKRNLLFLLERGDIWGSHLLPLACLSLCLSFGTEQDNNRSALLCKKGEIRKLSSSPISFSRWRRSHTPGQKKSDLRCGRRGHREALTYALPGPSRPRAEQDWSRRDPPAYFSLVQHVGGMDLVMHM